MSVLHVIIETVVIDPIILINGLSYSVYLNLLELLKSSHETCSKERVRQKIFD